MNPTIYNIASQLSQVEKASTPASGSTASTPLSLPSLPTDPVYQFKGHRTEGYALDWSLCEKGLLATGKCRLAVATTGIAGPKSDNTAKPVGLAYIAAGTRDNLKVYKFNYVGDRERITRTAINDALFLAYRALK